MSVRKLVRWRWVPLVFTLAMLARGIVFLTVDWHDDVIRKAQSDSRIFISVAQEFLRNGTFAPMNRSPELYEERTPGYPLFLAFLMWVLGNGLLPVVCIQAFMDCISCFLVLQFGEEVAEGSGLLSGLMAVVNVAMITYSYFILNDSLFLFIFLFVLIGIRRFMSQPSLRKGVLLGAVMGITALIRPVVMYLPALLIPFFLLFFIFKHRSPISVALSRSLIVGLGFIVCISPWPIRNYIEYGHLSLTAQSGEHLLQYVVPFVWEYSKGIPFMEGMREAEVVFEKKAKEDGFDVEKANPFELSRYQEKTAIEYLRREPGSAICKAWISGMVKNVFSPAIIDLSYLYPNWKDLKDRPHFLKGEGKTLSQRALNFIRGMSGLFGWLVVLSLVLMVVTRVIQIWGLLVIAGRQKWDAILLSLIPLYFLMVSGPVGYAKYRLPFEPILAVLVGVGLRDIYGRLAKTRSNVSAFSEEEG